MKKLWLNIRNFFVDVLWEFGCFLEFMWWNERIVMFILMICLFGILCEIFKF